MPTPPEYNRGHSFLDEQTNSQPTSGSALDSQLDAVSQSINSIIAELARIQRSDGELASNSVGSEQLKSDLTDAISDQIIADTSLNVVECQASATLAQAFAVDSIQFADQAFQSSIDAMGAESTALLARDEAVGARQDAEAAASVVADALIPAQNAEARALGYRDETGLIRDVTVQWAELLAGPVMPPDPIAPTEIPPGSAADWVEAVSQGHFSARWWAWWISRRYGGRLGGVVLQGSATVAEVNALVDPEPGEAWRMEDAGTVNPGGAVVAINDIVVWTAVDGWYNFGPMLQGPAGQMGPAGADAPDEFALLSDTPADYIDQAGRLVAVKQTEDGVEFVDPPDVGAGGAASIDPFPYKGPNDYVATGTLAQSNGSGLFTPSAGWLGSNTLERIPGVLDYTTDGATRDGQDPGGFELRVMDPTLPLADDFADSGLVEYVGYPRGGGGHVSLGQGQLINARLGRTVANTNVSLGGQSIDTMDPALPSSMWNTFVTRVQEMLALIPDVDFLDIFNFIQYETDAQNGMAPTEWAGKFFDIWEAGIAAGIFDRDRTRVYLYEGVKSENFIEYFEGLRVVEENTNQRFKVMKSDGFTSPDNLHFYGEYAMLHGYNSVDDLTGVLAAKTVGSRPIQRRAAQTPINAPFNFAGETAFDIGALQGTALAAGEWAVNSQRTVLRIAKVAADGSSPDLSAIVGSLSPYEVSFTSLLGTFLGAKLRLSIRSNPYDHGDHYSWEVVSLEEYGTIANLTTFQLTSSAPVPGAEGDKDRLEVSSGVGGLLLQEQSGGQLAEDEFLKLVPDSRDVALAIDWKKTNSYGALRFEMLGNQLWQTLRARTQGIFFLTAGAGGSLTYRNPEETAKEADGESLVCWGSDYDAHKVWADTRFYLGLGGVGWNASLPSLQSFPAGHQVVVGPERTRDDDTGLVLTGRAGRVSRLSFEDPTDKLATKAAIAFDHTADQLQIDSPTSIAIDQSRRVMIGHNDETKFTAGFGRVSVEGSVQAGDVAPSTGGGGITIMGAFGTGIIVSQNAADAPLVATRPMHIRSQDLTFFGPSYRIESLVDVAATHLFDFVTDVGWVTAPGELLTNSYIRADGAYVDADGLNYSTKLVELEARIVALEP